MAIPFAKNRLSQLARSVSLLALCLSTSSALASGGDEFFESVFAPEFHVANQEIKQYAAGNLGIVSGSYWRIFHLLAYRAASGQTLSLDEQNLFALARWNVVPGKLGVEVAPNKTAPDNVELDALQKWLLARKTADGKGEIKLDAMAETTEYDYYLNCHDDAFTRATQTLQERLKTGGKQWASVWRANQDAVFANCNATFDKIKNKRPFYPLPALPANVPAWLKHDYDYQSASALFYAGQFEAARAKFQQIAKASDSPWQSLGNYLATRCLIRQATLILQPPKREAMLETARAELVAQGKSYAPAQQLLGWVDARLRPQLRLQEVGQQLASGKLKESSVQLLIDYLALMDKVPNLDQMASNEAMTAWIGAMQGNAALTWYDSSDKTPNRKQAMQVARKFWAKKREPHWLMPLLSNAKVGELTPDEIKAASSVPNSSPAYQTLQFHLTRLLIVENKLDQADAQVNLALASTNLLASTRNRWLRMKLATAKTQEEFLQAGKRQAVEKEISFDEDTRQPKDKQPNSENDFIRHLLQHFPIAQLKQALPATKEINFPLWYTWRDSTTPELAVAIWTRAVLLGDYATADEVTDQVLAGREKGAATTKHLYQRFKDAKDAKGKRDAALLIFINAPELQPYTILPDGKGLYWGCAANWTTDFMQEADLAVPNFMSKEARATMQKEQKKLLALPIRSEYLAPQLFEYAKSNPEDPEVPKALHFLVASTRLECPSGPFIQRDEKLKPPYSKQAFQLLHKKYPKSEWAQKTKYFF